MLRVGVIGTGIIGEKHGSTLFELEGAVVAASADIDRAKAVAFQEKYGGAVYTNYQQMVLEQELDAVVINLPHSLHQEAAVFCMEHKLHVLLEKPMANTVMECKQILEAAKKNAVVLMLGHVQRYFAENRKAKELIESGWYGRLAAITDIRNIDYFKDSRPAWFFSKKLAGGGILMNYGAHSLDKLLWITGLEVETINGKVFQHQQGYEIEGGAQLLVSLQNHVTAVVSYCGYKVPPMNETTFYLTEGVIKLSTGSGLWASRGGRLAKVRITDAEDAFALMWRDFMGAVLSGQTGYPDGEYGMKIIQTIEGIYEQSSDELSVK